MSTLIQTFNLGHQAGERTLFNDINFSINRGDRIGLIGHNGCGKSTLVALLARQYQPDQGRIQYHSDCRLGVVEQYLSPELAAMTVLDATLAPLPEAERLHQCYQAEILLQQLGFDPEVFPSRVSTLSGGQQNKLMLARAMINEPTLLLLDEPSNHLDLAAQVALEQFLQQCRVAFVIISHDRQLLDAVTRRTLVMRDGQLLSFSLPFSQARQALAAQDEADAARHQQQQVQIDRLKHSAKRLAVWGRTYDNEDLSRKAKHMEKRIDRLQEQQTVVARGSSLSLQMQSSELRSRQLMALEQMTIHCPGSDRLLLTIDSLVIKPGDRIALLGNNGSGKTTTLSAIMAAYEGSATIDGIRLNPNLKIGYYDQLQHRLAGELNLVDAVSAGQSVSPQLARQTLIKAGFAYRDHQKLVKDLSGGEKARVIFQQMWLQQPNLQILDEPTNHLDIEGRQELEQQLLSTDASAIVTSHDRHFIETVCNRFLLICDGQLVELYQLPDWSLLMDADRTASPIPVNDSDPSDTGLASTVMDEELLLTELCLLEEKLTADQQRKAKYQKPAKQQLWQQQIEALQQQLGL